MVTNDCVLCGRGGHGANQCPMKMARGLAAELTELQDKFAIEKMRRRIEHPLGGLSFVQEKREPLAFLDEDLLCGDE